MKKQRSLLILSLGYLCAVTHAAYEDAALMCNGVDVFARQMVVSDLDGGIDTTKSSTYQNLNLATTTYTETPANCSGPVAQNSTGVWFALGGPSEHSVTACAESTIAISVFSAPTSNPVNITCADLSCEAFESEPAVSMPPDKPLCTSDLSKVAYLSFEANDSRDYFVYVHFPQGTNFTIVNTVRALPGSNITATPVTPPTASPTTSAPTSSPASLSKSSSYLTTLSKIAFLFAICTAALNIVL